MTPEAILEANLDVFRRFVEQGAEVVYGSKANAKFSLGLQPFTSVRGDKKNKPDNTELRSEQDVRKWLS